VLYRCKGDLHPNLMIEILEHSTIEILGIVDGDLLRNSVTTDDVLPEKILDGGGGYVGYRLRFNPFGDVFHRDNDKSAISLCWYKFAHGIDALPLQGPGWGYQLRRLRGSSTAMREFWQASQVLALIKQRLHAPTCRVNV
jgi:hypothetical protein